MCQFTSLLTEHFDFRLAIAFKLLKFNSAFIFHSIQFFPISIFAKKENNNNKVNYTPVPKNQNKE